MREKCAVALVGGRRSGRRRGTVMIVAAERVALLGAAYRGRYSSRCSEFVMHHHGYHDITFRGIKQQKNDSEKWSPERRFTFWKEYDPVSSTQTVTACKVSHQGYSFNGGRSSSNPRYSVCIHLCLDMYICLRH